MELQQARQQCTEAESRKAIHMPEEDDLEYLSAVDRWEISSDSSIDEVHDYLMGPSIQVRCSALLMQCLLSQDLPTKVVATM